MTGTTSGTHERLRRVAIGACVVISLCAAGCSSEKTQQAQVKWDATWAPARAQWDTAADRFEHANARWNQTYEDRFHAKFSRYVRPSQYRLDPMLPDPPADEATTVRDWERVVYGYPNGSTPAYPTYNFNYEDRPQWLENDYYYALAQPGIVMLDVALLPVWLFAEPPWVDINYHGARYGPSMTVAPPLPAQ